MKNEIYLIAESGKPKEILDAWRQDFFAAERRLMDLAKDIGAVKVFRFDRFAKPGSFGFKGNKAPDGWLKPGRQGATRPKKSNTEMQNRIDGLKWCEPLRSVVSEKLGMALGCHYEDGNGTRGVRHFSRGTIVDHSACWTTAEDGSLADVILIAPKPSPSVEGAQKITALIPEGTSIEIPDGFREMSEAEVDLMFAQAEVDREKARDSGNAPAM